MIDTLEAGQFRVFYCKDEFEFFILLNVDFYSRGSILHGIDEATMWNVFSSIEGMTRAPNRWLLKHTHLLNSPNVRSWELTELSKRNVELIMNQKENTDG